ncbi:MAG: cell division protein FtsZ [Odoribacteraceae bacterium]|jgi:cell division protein FtsZ|nr:cell division protein FtsZ [Odoribacteraceae bacterium]
MFMDNRLININIPVQEPSIIKVLGVGGGGCNAVNYMYAQGIQGVEFVVCNTDIQVLRVSPVRNRIQIGKALTEGDGAGSHPERGEKSAVESIEYIRSMLENNTEMLFITAGMGGGTGTGAAPVIAELSRSLGILTIAIVTIPFHFEGRRRIEQALEGIEKLSKHVDALLIICNEKLREIYGDLKLSKAFAKADDVLAIAARSIAEIITKRGKVNVDLNDVKSVMSNSGVALMGAGDAKGENRAMEAVKAALNSPLLNSSDIRGASNILLNILYGDQEVTINEQESVKAYLKELVGHDVDINWGSGYDEALGDKLRIVVIATGFNRVSLESSRSPKIPFLVEEVEELEMSPEDPRQLEEEGRRRRQRQEQRKMQQQKEEQPDRVHREETIREQPSRRQGVNTIPDVNGWFQRCFGSIFASNLERDTEI